MIRRSARWRTPLAQRTAAALRSTKTTTLAPHRHCSTQLETSGPVSRPRHSSVGQNSTFRVSQNFGLASRENCSVDVCQIVRRLGLCRLRLA